MNDYLKINKEKLISNDKAVFKGSKYRITILSEILIRLEYDEAGIFMDQATELVSNRKFPLPDFDVQEDDRVLVITTKYFRLQYMKNKPFYASSFAPDANLRIMLLDTDKYWYFGHDEARNFGSLKYNLDMEDYYVTPSQKVLNKKMLENNQKKTVKTKDTTFNKGLYSTDGFVAIDDSNSLIVDDDGYLVKNERKYIDTYVFMYKRDFGNCLKDYFLLTGSAPLIPRYSLGIWWFKDEAYSLEDIKRLLVSFNKYGLPLSVLLLGENWHIKDRNNPDRFKSGFTFNQELLGNPLEFSTYLHDRGIRLGLNIDPAEGIHPHEFKFNDFARSLGIDDQQIIPFNAFDKNFINNYFEKLITPLYNAGVDFFWIDYHTRDYQALTALDYYHFNDYLRFTNKRGLVITRPPKKVMHRYPISYSGKTLVSWDTLKKASYEVANIANIGVSWYSSDIGGFSGGIEDADLYRRYVQFGCFSPILRLAATKGNYYKREPWRWDVKTFGIVKDYLVLRQRLVGYLYAEAYKYYKVGIPVIRPIYYTVPEIYDEADYRNEYYFGSELLVAPIIKPRDEVMERAVEKIYLPEGIWYDFKTGKKFIGNKRYVAFYKDEDYPVFAKSGSIVPLANLEENINVTAPPKSLEIHVFPGKSNIYNLYEDDGVSSLYKEGYYIVTRIDYNYLQNNYTLIIRPFEGKSGIIPEKRDYKIRFRNTRNAQDVKVMLEAEPISFDSYTEDNDFIVLVNDVSTVKQLTIICKGSDIEIDASRILNEDIDSIISDLPIKTTLKESVSKIMFGTDDISDKRIKIRKLKKEGLDNLFVRLFLKLLDYTRNI